MEQRQAGLSAILFLQLLGLVNISFGAMIYWSDDLEALQAILAAWSATPDQLNSLDLDGWNASQKFPCSSLNGPDATTPNWRGVQCLVNNCTTAENSSYNCNIYVVRLSISNASIVGTLPPEIGNLAWMSMLELTGNPWLTGPLPETISNMWLNVLDLHDNGFDGSIPNFKFLWNLLQLDLSGNKFTGPFPFEQTSTMDYLQIFSIGGNDLAGEIKPNAFENKTKLERLDISNNHFNGTLPFLNHMASMTYLDVSRNEFVGQLPNLLNAYTLLTANFSGNMLNWTGRLQDTFNLNAKLTKLDLSYNKLGGDLPRWDRASLGSIQQLYLHNNSLIGTLDIVTMKDLGLLRGMSENSTGKLEVMSLSNNSITHVIYDDSILKFISPIFKLDGNPFCDDYDSGNDGQRCFCAQICFLTPAKKNSRKIIITAATSSVLAVTLIVAVIGGAMIQKNRRYKKYLQLQFSKKFDEYDVKPTIFSFSELRAATRDFHDDIKLGQGGYGAVYKGVLPSGNVVAVKQLYIKTAQGLDEFLNY